MKKLMTGNEALALGAWEAGCHLATGYPGTPSTEILENLSAYKEVHSQWAPNEKVALEVAAGGSAAGGRVICTMKVVGLNVAMDPLMTFAYMGVRGGLVVIVADDPGCSSSQTEQDNRLIAPLAKIPLIEPSDSQECKDFLKAAFEVSEKFDVPVLFRVTTRVCHSKSLVEVGRRREAPIRPYEKTGKYCSGPALSRVNHQRLEDMLPKLEEYSESSPLNRVEWGDKSVGVIASGISYQHAREVFGEKASYLKLGLTHRAPSRLIRDFAREVQKLYVIEENDPYLENTVKLLGVDCVGKARLPLVCDLSPEIIRAALLGEKPAPPYRIEASPPPRPPVLCAGCPHRSAFYAVSRLKNVVAANDIGCYTLGMAPPLNVTDTIVCMGAGISAGLGLERVLRLSGQNDKKVFGFIGDSTFFHSGITALIDAVWNKSNLAVCILDNRTTAMTGHQQHPGTGRTLRGEESVALDIEAIVKAVGVPPEQVRLVDAYDLAAVRGAVKEAADSEGVFVIISRAPCALIKEAQKQRAGMSCRIDPEKCQKCQSCLRIGCPAVVRRGETVSIDAQSCNGCGLCFQVCKFDAIGKEGGPK
ncbi:MAG: indolepyruvate ferredoxin oxidoreductase subunit alpha [Candidatus Adiutrix sp.]|jgi:indolepyruvate ferredoxin oxidoreductase alpha subunit|nr:indolepyruvate ferredoxin oxidoreductase subunit alpha [Candidatus Adiutrix sp.]